MIERLLCYNRAVYEALRSVLRPGLRIENTYRVTAKGIVNLFSYPLEPEYFIIRR